MAGMSEKVRVSIHEGRTLFSIQYLRAVAALLVVYQHARGQLPGFKEALTSPIGEMGVDLFFVISGFIMVVTTYRQPVGPGTFMLRRIARIVPTYWFYTTALTLLVLLAPSAVKMQLTWSHYLYSLFFITHVNPVDMTISPILRPGWTLNFEMFFYCLFAVTLLLPAKVRTAALSVILAAFVVGGWIFAPTDPVLGFYTSPIVLEFAFGVIVGHAYVTGRLNGIGHGSGWIMVGVGIVLAFISASWWLPEPAVDFEIVPQRAGTYGVAAVLIVVGCLALEWKARAGRKPPVFARLGLLGDASYSVYLTHLFPIAILRMVWLKLDLPVRGLDNTLAFVALSVASCAMIGVLSYLVIERPATRVAQRVVRHRLTPAPV
jgi:exopolysaccharide production protein ExoZ